MKDTEKRKTTSCGGIAWRDVAGKRQVLLIRQFKNKQTWGIPKGHMNVGESLEQCAIREIFEETGVHVSLNERLVDVLSTYRNEEKTVVSFIARPVDPTSCEVDGTNPESEVAEARWFDIDSLPAIQPYQVPLVASCVETIAALEASCLQNQSFQPSMKSIRTLVHAMNGSGSRKRSFERCRLTNEESFRLAIRSQRNR